MDTKQCIINKERKEKELYKNDQMVLSLFNDGMQIETKGTGCKLAPSKES
jgi:hypothetical protein